jgi:hypothetical protein
MFMRLDHIASFIVNQNKHRIRMDNSRAKVTPWLLFAGTFSCITGIDTTTISTENRELPLAKIYENSSLDYSFFCTFDPRSNAGLLRERIRHDHDQNSTSSAGTHHGGLRSLLIVAAPLSTAKMNLPLFEIACVLVRLNHVACFIE